MAVAENSSKEVLPIEMCGFVLVAAKRDRCLPDISTRKIESLSGIMNRGDDEVNWELDPQNGTFCLFSRLTITGASVSESSQPFVAPGYIALYQGENYQSLPDESDSYAYHKSFLGGRKPFAVSGPRVYLYWNKENRNGVVHIDRLGERAVFAWSDDNIAVYSSNLRSIVFVVKNILNKKLTVSELDAIDFFAKGYVSRGSVFNEISLISESTEDLEVVHDDGFTGNFVNDYSLKVNVPSCFLFSGGVDSTLVVARALELGLPVNALMVDEFMGRRSREHAMRLADRLNLRFGNNFNLARTSDLGRVDLDLEQLALVNDNLSSDGLNMLASLVAIRKFFPFTKVVYSGVGGDEFFSGYSSHRALTFRHILPILSKVNKRWARFKLNGQVFDFDSVVGFYAAYRFGSFVLRLDSFSGDLFSRYFSYLKSVLKDGNFFHKYFPEQNREARTTKKMRSVLRELEISDYLRNQLFRDSESIGLAFGVEVRAPLVSTLESRFFHRSKAVLVDEINRIVPYEPVQKEGFRFDCGTQPIAWADLNKSREFLGESLARCIYQHQLSDPQFSKRLMIFENWHVFDY